VAALTSLNARELALLALRQAHQGGTYVQDRLHDLLSEHELSDADRSLATEIALATVRHRRTIDLLLASLLAKPIHKTDLATHLVLQSAAYQIIFLERVPDYAVVDEAVRLVRKAGSPHMTGLVNAVLRRVADLIDRNANPAQVGDPRRIVPLPHGGSVVLKQPLLAADDVGRLADAYSFPDVLVSRWCSRWGARKTERVLAALNRPPRLFARVNTLRTSARDLVAHLPEAVREAVQPTSEKNKKNEKVVDLTGLPHPSLLALLEQGLVTVEDPTAMLAVEALEARPGETVLDLCAAPGGKTSYLAELMKGEGLIFALDREGPRLDLLRHTCRRLKLDNVRVLANESAALSDDMPTEFDRVLIDVPCSNTGVLNRRAEARWRLSQKSIRSLNDLQLQLLEQGARATRTGGLCLYSTCSLEPEENGRLVRRFLQDNPWMALQSELETLPSESGDGGYFARMKRIEGGPGSQATDLTPRPNGL